MNDEFDRLMSLPRLCRVCGKACQGIRCGVCYSIEGRLVRFIGDAGKGGMSETKIAQMMTVESALRELEREQYIHETPIGWENGLHPYQEQLRNAWEARKAAKNQG